MQKETAHYDEKLDRVRGSGPLWLQVKNALLQMIAEKPLGEHARLPTEAQLCSRYGVSRTVVREAMNQLVMDRTIYKIQGKGAFVASRREEQDFFGSTISFSSDILGRHKRVERVMLGQSLKTPDERVQQMLGLRGEDQVAELYRLFKVDGLPRLVVRSHIPAALAPGLDSMPLDNRSLYETLRKQYGLGLRYADRWIEAALPDARQAELLDLPMGTPVLAVESCSYSEGEQPVEYYQGLYRSSEARLHIRVGSR